MAKKAGKFLRTLNLKHITAVTDQQLQEVIKACPNLQTLNLLGWWEDITDAVIKDLPKDLQSSLI